MSYEPKTVLLQLEDINQELIDAAATYKSGVHHANNDLLLTINIPIKVPIDHLQYYHTHSSTSLNINQSLKAKDTIKITVSRRPITICLMLCLLLTQVVLVPQHPPLKSISQ